MEVLDRRKTEHKLTEDERAELTAQVVLLREAGMSWAAIATEIGVASPSTPRKLYGETGRDHHGLLPGKGGRNIEWAPGDWCDARCIGAHPKSPCACKCERENHAAGLDRAKDILANKEVPEEKAKAILEHVAEIVEANNIEQE